MLTERWVFRAIPEAAVDARRAARQIGERLGADASFVSSLVLCVSEAVANVVAHAYRHQPDPGQVVLEARRPAGALLLAVRDRGCGMAPRDDSPGAGFGLGLISALAGGVAVRDVEPSGTELVMSFAVDDDQARAPEAPRPAS